MILNTYSIHAAKRLGFLAKVKGTVFIKEKGKKEKKAKKNTKIKEGSSIITKEASTARVILKNGQILNIGEKSNITIDEKLLGKNKKDKGTFLNIKAGSVRGIVSKTFGIDTKKKSKYKLHIKTSSAVAGIRGTEFIVNDLGKDKGSTFVSFDDSFDVGKNFSSGGGIKNPTRVKTGEFAKVAKKILPPAAIDPSQFRALKNNDISGKPRSEIIDPNTGKTKKINNIQPIGVDTRSEPPKGVFDQKANEFTPPPPKGFLMKGDTVVKERAPQVMVNMKEGSFVPVVSAAGEFEGKLYTALNKKKTYRKLVNDEIKTKQKHGEANKKLIEAQKSGDKKLAKSLKKRLGKMGLRIKKAEKKRLKIKKTTIEKEVVPAIKKEMKTQKGSDAPKNLELEIKKAELNAKMTELDINRADVEEKKIQAAETGNEKALSEANQKLEQVNQELGNTKENFKKIEGQVLVSRLSSVNDHFGDFIEDKTKTRVVIRNEITGKATMTELDMREFERGDRGPRRGEPPPDFIARIMDEVGGGNIDIYITPIGGGPYDPRLGGGGEPKIDPMCKIDPSLCMGPREPCEGSGCECIPPNCGPPPDDQCNGDCYLCPWLCSSHECPPNCGPVGMEDFGDVERRTIVIKVKTK